MSHTRCVNFNPIDRFVFVLSKFRKCILKIVTEYICPTLYIQHISDIFNTSDTSKSDNNIFTTSDIFSISNTSKTSDTCKKFQHLIYTVQKKYCYTTLNNVFNIFYLVLKYNIYINLKLVQFPIYWGEKLFFVTTMNNVTAS